MKYNLSIINFVVYFINRRFHGGLVPYPFPRNGTYYVERRNRGHDFQLRLSSTRGLCHLGMVTYF